LVEAAGILAVAVCFLLLTVPGVINRARTRRVKFVTVGVMTVLSFVIIPGIWYAVLVWGMLAGTWWSMEFCWVRPV
jgi:hypothetical protein